jgi:UDP-glucose:(heptosyl)LPS alpha-1,3-glucosyltransferase
MPPARCLGAAGERATGMRIALLARRFDPKGGGTERDLILTAECLRRGGHQVAVYADQIRAETTALTVHRVGTVPLPRTLAFIRFAVAAAPLARRHGTDLVLSFARVTSADVLRSGGSAHVSYLRAVARWRGEVSALRMRLAPYHRAQIVVERLGFTSSKLRAALAVSELVRRDLIEQFRLPAARVTTIYNGVDLQLFHPESDSGARNRIRAQSRIPADAELVLFVGNGFARKGLEFLIDAVAKVKSTPYLMVIGNDSAATSFQRRTQRRGIAERVIFAGAQPAVAEFFKAGDVLALPSLFEPFGNVALEAMACGRPALLSAQCGVAELLPEELRDYVVANPADPAEIASKLERLLRTANDLRPIARAAASRFTWEKHELELNRFIDSVS